MLEELLLILVLSILLCEMYKATQRSELITVKQISDEDKTGQGEEIEGFCAFGGLPTRSTIGTTPMIGFGGVPITPTFRHDGRAWPGWNSGPPWYPHSAVPSVWY